MKWKDEVERLPGWLVVLGVLGTWASTLGLSAWLIAVPEFDERSRISVEGELLDIQTPVVMNKRRVLDFRLRNQPVRFRVDSGIFSEALSSRVPDGFRTGATVKIQVPESEYKNPFSPAPYRVPTVFAEAIETADRKILTLDAARAWHHGNRRIAYYLMPLFVASAVFLSYAAWLKARARKRHAA